MATGCLSSTQHADVPGPRRFAGPTLPHRPLAARGRRLHRQAGRRDRHRLVRDPVDPAHRRAGGAPHRLPAHARTTRSRRTTGRSTPRRCSAVKADYAGFRQRNAARCRFGCELPAERRSRARGRRPRSARASTRSAGSRAASGSSAPFADLLIDRGGQRHRGRVRARARSARSCATRRSPRCCSPEAGHRLQAPVRRHRLLRDLQPAERHARRRRARRRSRRSLPHGLRDDGAGRTSSTASCSPPASTP